MNLLDRAIAESIRWPVFPLNADKRPTCANGFKDASQDPAVLADLFSHPDAALIGAPTGEVSGLDVLDIDPGAGGFDWLDGHMHLLPETEVQYTRKPGGMHYLFAHHPGMRSSASKIARGVDVRADGGYIVRWSATGNRVDHAGVLAPWPDFLIIQAQRSRLLSTGAGALKPEDLAPPSVAVLVDLLERLPNPESATRDDYLQICLSVQGCIRGLEATGGCEDPEPIVHAAAEWAARWGGPNPGSYIAEREKWESDWSHRDSDMAGWRNLLALATRLGHDTVEVRHAQAVAEFAVAPMPPLACPQAGRLRLISPADCDAEPGREYIIKGLLSVGDVACIFGAPGAGKSIVAPHLAYAVAQGRRAFGLRVRQGKAWYVAAEDSHGMRQRVRGLRLSHGDAPDFALVQGVGSLLDPAEVAALRALAIEHKPALIMIDTVAMAFPGIDENTSADMGRVVAAARALAEGGAAVVLVHHDAKAADGTPRGHSILNGALDVALLLGKTDDSGIIRGKLTKNRNGPCAVDIAFRIDPVTLGTDSDGDEITAPTAREASGRAESTGPKLTRMQRAALDVLRDVLAKAGGHDVPEADWREACEDRRVSTSENPKSRREAFSAAFAALRDLGVVVAGGGLVRLPDMAPDFSNPPAGAEAEKAEFRPNQQIPPRQSGGKAAEKAESAYRHSAYSASADAPSPESILGSPWRSPAPPLAALIFPPL